MTNESVPNTKPSTVTPRPTSRPGGHGWMMMVCCIPMVAIAIALVATGVASSSFLLTAGLCVGMMFMMMRMMDHSGGHTST